MRDSGELVEGHLYRITDYMTTTKQSNTKSANHPFDVIVLAISHNALSHLARAIAHEGDTYFDGNNLSAWQIWYDLDNDTEKYGWADAENGKGVIYRMIDEKRNDCPYDFKNILFYNDKYTIYTTSDKYYYTFSYVVSGMLYDGTVNKQVTGCYGNSMGAHGIKKRKLNINVWRNSDFKYYNRNNILGNGCYDNTFWDSCSNNIFGDSCSNNTFRDYCNNNILGNGCHNNIFGDSCNKNTFGDYCNNIFGNKCADNIFGDHCYGNIFGENCNFNVFRGYSNSNKIENNCNNNTIERYTYNKTINTENTFITCNEGYYDDGNGELVPIKHPDLSTQPSILPYKIAGNYVYEQLICLSEANCTVDPDFNDCIFCAIPWVAEVESPKILSASFFTSNSSFHWQSNIPVMVHANNRIIEARINRLGLLIAGSLPQEDGTIPTGWLRIEYSEFKDRGSSYYYQQNNPRLIFNNVDAEFDGTMLYFGIKFIPITGSNAHYEPSNGEKFIIEGDNLKTFMNDQTEDDGITFYYDLIPIMECNGEYIEPNPTLYRYKTQGTLTYSFKENFPSVYNALEAGEETIVNVYKPWTITVNVESEFVNSGYEPDVQLLGKEDGPMLGRITESGQYMDVLITDFLNNTSELYLAGNASYGGIYNPSTEERADFGHDSKIDINVIKEYLPLTYEQIINRQNVTLTVFST